MSQPSKSSSAFRSFFKWGGIALLLVAAVWIIVILWWQATLRVISGSDVLLYLVALPLCLLIAIGIFRFMRNKAKKNASAVRQPGAPVAAASDQITPAAKEKTWQLPIIGAWGATSLADNAQEFVQALLEKRSRPRPDAQLLDVRGFPLQSGRVPDLNTSTAQENILQIISKNGLAQLPAHDEWRDAFLRTVALLDQVMDQIQSDWPIQFEDMNEAQADLSSGMLRGTPLAQSRSQKSFNLQVKLLIPADFKAYEKQLCLAYLFEKISAFPIRKEHVQIEVVSANDDATALALLDKFNLQSHRTGEAEALLLLAGDSTLCSTVVEDWQSTGRLFSTHCPSGLMMGEAAFGVLCVSDQALETAKMEPLCHLTRVALDRRELSADLPGKPSSACLSAAVGEALLSAGVSGDAIGTVTCDVDHRTNRALECIGAMMHQTPQLDTIENRLAANEACGHIGAASVLGAFVAGVVQAKNASHPILVFNVSHMADRAAAVLLPYSELPQAA